MISGVWCGICNLYLLTLQLNTVRDTQSVTVLLSRVWSEETRTCERLANDRGPRVVGDGLSDTNRCDVLWHGESENVLP